jgi:hypothetical protein
VHCFVALNGAVCPTTGPESQASVDPALNLAVILLDDVIEIRNNSRAASSAKHALLFKRFPASSPFVLGVGGTKLVATRGNPPTIDSELVWNELLQNEGAGGGGISGVFSKPAYQNRLTLLSAITRSTSSGGIWPSILMMVDAHL